jgi:hypothetical protein
MKVENRIEGLGLTDLFANTKGKCVKRSIHLSTAVKLA